MRPALLALLVLLALAAILWMLWPDADGPPRGGAALPAAEAPPPDPQALRSLPPADPRLQGRTPPGGREALGRIRPRLPFVPPRPEAPPVRLRGTVRDERGAPVEGAQVYQLPKNAARGTGWVRAQTHSAADGSFTLLGTPSKGTWIAARAHGRRTTYLDGDALAAGGEVHLVLEALRPIVVQVVDAYGEPVWGASVRAVPTSRAGPAQAFSGPESTVSEQLEWTDAAGRAELSFAVSVPVVLLCEVEGMISVPREQRAEEAAGTFAFEMLAAGGIEVKAVDGEGKRIREHLHVALLDPDTGDELAVYRGSETDGALEAEPSVPPGPYHVEVSARGYEPALLAALEIPPGPGTVARTVTLRPLAAAAGLRLLLPEGRVETASGRAAPYHLLLRRADPGWIELGWRLRRDHTVLPAGDALEIRLRPGTWEAIVARPGADVVAVLEPLVLAAGAVVERRVHEVDGVTFPLYSVLPPDLHVRALRVRIPGLGLVPPFGVWIGHGTQDAQGLLSTIAPSGTSLRRDERGGAVLGPFPGGRVLVEVDDWRGATHRFPVR